MRSYLLPLLLLTALSGCYAATRSTVDLGKAEQQLAAARAAGAPERAVYAWTMADEYMKKARDEWGRSDYQRADAMLKNAVKWANEARSIAQAGGTGPQWSVDEPAPEAPVEGADAPPAQGTDAGVWQ